MKLALVRTPFVEAVFARLATLRERNPHPKVAWSQDWETFLEDSGLHTAEDEVEARRVAGLLVQDGLLELRLRCDGERVQRFTLPLASERGWFTAFQQIHPADVPDKRAELASTPWVPQLQFVSNSRVNVVLDDLLKLNDFLLKQTPTQVIVPIKERSLEIFGDEKRLDGLVSTSLFRAGRLDFARDLKCEIIAEPIAWKRGPTAAASGPVIAIENAATWHSYCRWNAERQIFSAVVYGCGNRFVDGFLFLPEIFRELGGQRRILYFGDLDPRGLEIPQEANLRAINLGLPPVEPHLWSYRQLLISGAGRGQPYDGEPPAPTLCDWLGDCAEPARQLFAANQRLAQEHIGWEFLREQTGTS